MTNNISIPALARVEGEGALYIRTKDNKIEEIELNIKDGNLFIESLEEEHKKLLEISDTEGSFSIWFDLTEDRKEKLKKILGP